MEDAEMGVVLPLVIFSALVSCVRVHNGASGNGTHDELLARVDAFMAEHPPFEVHPGLPAHDQEPVVQFTQEHVSEEVHA